MCVCERERERERPFVLVALVEMPSDATGTGVVVGTSGSSRTSSSLPSTWSPASGCSLGVFPATSVDGTDETGTAGKDCRVICQVKKGKFCIR